MDTLEEIIKKFITSQDTADINASSALFQQLVHSRNSLATDQVFNNYLDLQIKKIYQIPESHWQKYLTNKDIFISKLSFSGISSPYPPHFLSKIPQVKISYPDGVFGFVSQKYSELSPLVSKINLNSSAPSANFQYQSDTDTYQINIPETNHNQKVSMLIHELSHIISQEKQNHQMSSLYKSELAAHQIEFDLSESVSQEFLHAVIGEYLACLIRTDFQVSIYQDPSQDPLLLCSKTIKKYLEESNPEDIKRLLFDKKITLTPLTDLPDAVSLVYLLT